MKFFRPSIFVSLALSVLLIAGAYTATAPQSAFAASQGIVPCNGVDCQACHLVDLLQNLINFLLGLSIPISIGLFAYAGILYFTSASNPSNKGKARGIFSSALIGLIIALGAYLVVETVLHAVLTKSYWEGWNTIKCVNDSQRRTNTSIGDVFNQAVNTVINGTGLVPNAPTSQQGVGQTGNTFTGGPLTAGRLCSSNNPYCSVGTLESLGLSYAQAQAMSCIAVTESGGNPSIGCSATATPCGLYQINNGNWNAYAPADCRPYAMKNNGSCNLRTALIMMRYEGYQPWTGSSANGVHWNSNAVKCVQTYDPYTNLPT